MPMNFVLVVEDAGELKTIHREDLRCDELSDKAIAQLEYAINAILDRRAIDAGEYDPADNNTPMSFTWGDDDGQS